MANLRRRLEALEDNFGDESCEKCAGVYIVGIPTLFAVAYREHPGVERHEHLTHEEAQEFFYGCPECGEPVKTFPIIMRGLRAPDPEVPDPWPIAEWPEPLVERHRGNVYDEDEERERGVETWGH